MVTSVTDNAVACHFRTAIGNISNVKSMPVTVRRGGRGHRVERLGELDREIARSASHVTTTSVGLNSASLTPCGATLVYPEAVQVVVQVVTGRDGGEHLLHRGACRHLMRVTQKLLVPFGMSSTVEVGGLV